VSVSIMRFLLAAAAAVQIVFAAIDIESIQQASADSLLKNVRDGVGLLILANNSPIGVHR
jgi:hypothetical protein